MGMLTRVPDMLGYVASITYNNHHLPLPDDGGVNAMHRARSLHNLRVSICDAERHGEDGRIVFTSNPAVRALKKVRKYVQSLPYVS